MGSLVPGTPAKVVRAETVRQMVAGLPEGSLLVVGAPGDRGCSGSSSAQGAGFVRATAGAIVVRRCPDSMLPGDGDAHAVRISDAGSGGAATARGQCRSCRRGGAPDWNRAAQCLLTAPAGGDVTSVAEDPISVRDDDSIEVVSAIAASIDPIPVVDADGRLRGVIRR